MNGKLNWRRGWWGGLAVTGLVTLILILAPVPSGQAAATRLAFGAFEPGPAPGFLTYLPLVSNQVAEPAPLLLASDQPHPNSLAVDSQNVYWTNCGTDVSAPTDGAVMVYSRSQGVYHPLVTGLPCPAFLQADSDSLFWVEGPVTQGPGVFTIFRLSKRGGQPLELVSYTAPFGNLALDDAYVYWEENGWVMRLPKTGGTPEPAPVRSMVFDGPDAYWSNAQGELVRSAKDGSSQVTLVTRADLDALAGRQPSNVYILQIFPNLPDLYFTVFVDNYPGWISCTDQNTELMRMPKSGGKFEYLFSAPRRMSAHVIEPFAYFSADCIHPPLQVNLESLAVEPSDAWSELPVAMAADPASVYWVDYTNGWIKRMDR